MRAGSSGFWSLRRRRLFGTVTAGRGQFILQSAARGGRDVITLQTNGDVPCSEGDLVEAEMLRRRGHMGKTARVIANLGPSDSPARSVRWRWLNSTFRMSFLRRLLQKLMA